MAAILNSATLNSAILGSDTLLSSLRFTQKYSHSTLTLTQTNQSDSNSFNLIWWWQPSWILPSWIQTALILDSDTLLSSLRFHLKNTLTPLWLWLKLIHFDSLDDASHLEICHIRFSHFAHIAILDSAILVFPLKITHTCQDWFPLICTKKLHSFILPQLDWWWQPSWILPCWIQTLPSWIQTPCYLLSDSLRNTLTPLRLWLILIQSDWNSFPLT